MKYQIYWRQYKTLPTMKPRLMPIFNYCDYDEDSTNNNDNNHENEIEIDREDRIG